VERREGEVIWIPVLMGVLRIIELSMEIWLEELKGMTQAQKEERWAKREERMKFWEDWAESLRDTILQDQAKGQTQGQTQASIAIQANDIVPKTNSR
jgi:hypothetical protein